MPKAALISYLVFAFVAFGWRTWRQYQDTGDSGFRGISGGLLGRTASGLFLSGLVVSPIAPVLQLAGWIQPLVVPPAIYAIGIGAFALGFGLTLVAQLQMGESWRIGVSTSERTALVTHGVFSIVRNPIFTGMLLALLGMVLLVPHMLTVVAVVLTLVGLELQVRFVEEPYLFATHGAEYHAYTGSVGRFAPGLGRLH